MQPRPHRIAIAPSSHQLEIQEVTAVSSAVVQHQGRISVVGDYNVPETVVVEIGERNAAPDVRSAKAVARRLAHVHKLAIVIVVEERVELFVADVRRGLLNFWIHVAVGNKNIQPAIVVVVEEAPAKAQDVMRRSSNPGAVAHLVKETLAVVLPKVIGGPLEIRNVQVQPAVVFKVSQRDAHGRHGQPLTGQGHAADQPYLFEGAIALVVVEIGVGAVVSDKQTGPAVIVVIGSAYGEILAFWLVDFGLDGHVGESSVAVIVVQGVRTAPVSTGGTTAEHPAQIAIPTVD